MGMAAPPPQFAMQPQQPAPPARGLPRDPSQTGYRGRNAPCKFGRKCTRKDCFFQHSEGREMDDGYVLESDSDKDIQEIEEAIAQDEEAKKQKLLDDDSGTWFPQSRNCACCRGYTLSCECKEEECSKCRDGKVLEPVASDEHTETVSSWAPWKDEWFPECRECECCSGYKYRCETDECRTAGVCIKCRE